MSISAAQTRAFQEAFRVACAVTMATFIWKYTHIPHGYWILLTVGVIYIGTNQGIVLQRANRRVLGTILGLLFAFLFVRMFMYHDYRWGYTLPVAWFFMFYLMYVTGNYAIMVACLTVFVCVLMAMLTPVYNNFDLWETLFCRILNTVIGALIVVVTELTIFTHATRTVSEMERTMTGLLDDLAYMARSLTACYVEQRLLTTNERGRISSMIEKYASTRELRVLMQYELCTDERYNTFYDRNIQRVSRIISVLRRMFCIVNHPGTDKAGAEETESIGRAAEIVSNALESMKLSVAEQEATPHESVETRVSALFDGQTRNSFYAEGIEKLAKAADELRAVLSSAPA